MRKIGVITYHSAYNFGSNLQALATQKMIEKLGYDVEIINYRPVEQYNFYSTFPRGYGLKGFAKNIMRIPYRNRYTARSKAYEDFLKTNMSLSSELNSPEDVYDYWNRYDLIVSGSDQIWNKHSNELQHVGWEYMNPYLLQGYGGNKVSYASSIGGMTIEEIKRIVPSLEDFQVISCREKSTADILSEMVGRTVFHVLDPTLLLNNVDWIHLMNIPVSEENDYVLYYSLGSARGYMQRMKALNEFGKKNKCKVLVVTPLINIPVFFPYLEFHPEYATKDIFTCIINSQGVITDSYHATLFSLNLKKKFCSICGKGGSEFRKTEILNDLQLNERISSDIEEATKKLFKPISYGLANNKMNAEREKSIELLKRMCQDT